MERCFREPLQGRNGPDELLLAIATALNGKIQHRIESNPYVLFNNYPLLPELLLSCIEATGADFGNIQLFDSSRQRLAIVSQQGFGNEVLDYFGTVCSGSFYCGKAMNQRSRVIVPDVASDPLFPDKQTLDVMLRAGVRSCQSTPLIASSGKFIGVASTHFERAGKLSPKLLKNVDAIIAPLLEEITSTAMLPGEN